MGFHPQTQKVELHVHSMSPYLTLGVKGLHKVTSDKLPDSPFKLANVFSCETQGEFDITSKVT